LRSTRAASRAGSWFQRRRGVPSMSTTIVPSSWTSTRQPARAGSQCHSPSEAPVSSGVYGRGGTSSRAVAWGRRARSSPHRTWRWHRAAWSVAGPSWGQVPRVALNESVTTLDEHRCRDDRVFARRRAMEATA
jgi:hypothetical protein